MTETRKAYKTYSVRIRLDANNLWDDEEHAIKQLAPIKRLLFAVEEPIKAHYWDGLSKIAKSLGIKIILDESFTNKSDFQKLIANPQYWIINLRVSKLLKGSIKGVGVIKNKSLRPLLFLLYSFYL